MQELFVATIHVKNSGCGIDNVHTLGTAFPSKGDAIDAILKFAYDKVIFTSRFVVNDGNECSLEQLPLNDIPMCKNMLHSFILFEAELKSPKNHGSYICENDPYEVGAFVTRLDLSKVKPDKEPSQKEQECYAVMSSENSPLGVGRPHVLGICKDKDSAKKFLMEYARDAVMSYPESGYAQSYEMILKKIGYDIEKHNCAKILSDLDDPLSVMELLKIEKTTIS